jgi:glycosyltransferase involved in cell wall biosynthesis
MGVPAVITPGVHFPEVGSAGAGEVVEPRADALAAALLRITTNAQLRERMSDAAKALIASRYTWPRIAEESLRAFERLVGPVHR